MDSLPLAVAHIAWRTGQVVPPVALLLAALACGVTLLYLRQTSRTPWPWRIVLMALRTLALTALALSLLKPTLSRDAKPSEEGAVLVVVDRSHSMSLHDGLRHPGQLVALADGLGLIPSKLRSRGDEWIGVAADLNTGVTDLTDAQSRLAFARISGLNAADAEAQVSSAAERFVGVSQSALGRQPAPPAGTPLGRALGKLRQAAEQPRGADLAAHWLPGVQAAVEAVAEAAGTFQLDADQELYRANPQVHAACDRLAKMSRLQLVDEALTAEPSGLLHHLPDGTPVYGFAAGESVEPLPLSGPGGRPVRRLLVDANSSGTELGAAVRDAIDQMRGGAVRAVVLFSDGRQPRSHGSVAGTAGVPVFAVSPAPFPGPRGPKVGDLSMTESPLPVAVCTGETFTVRGRIYDEGVPADSQRRVECLVDGKPQASTTVRVQPGAAATGVTFDLHIDTPGPHRVGLRLPEAGEEASDENNAAERWLKVMPGRSAVVTWSESPTWDWQLANEAISSVGGFDVRARSATTLPSTVPDDARAVLLFGLDPHAVTEAQARELDAFVRERGGLLVITANPDRPLSDYAAPASLAELLPFTLGHPATGGDWTAWYGDEPVYHFEPPDARPEERTRWASLPPLYRFASLPPLKPSARPLLVERDTRAAVAARIPAGAGQVVFVGIDETWRWRYHDPAAAGRFWTDLVRQWAEPPYAVTDGPLALDVERAAVEPHESFGVRAKLFAGGPASLAVRVLGADGAEVRRDVLPRTGPGRYAATLGGLPAGAYQIEVIARLADAAIRMLRYPLQVVPAYANEAENPTTSRDVLQHLADASGGRLLAMEELRQLPTALAGTAEVRVVPVPLWDSAYLFVFVAACFCAEWALRKRLGLG